MWRCPVFSHSYAPAAARAAPLPDVVTHSADSVRPSRRPATEHMPARKCPDVTPFAWARGDEPSAQPTTHIHHDRRPASFRQRAKGYRKSDCGPFSIRVVEVTALVSTTPERNIPMTLSVGSQQLVGTWTIDPVHSSIAFSVRHLMVTKVRGEFGQFSGTITVADDGTASVAADIAIDSISTGNPQRDADVKSPIFFDTAQFPNATFVSRSVRADGDGYLLDGDLTIKGVTRSVTLEMSFNGVNPGMGHGEVAGFEASTVLLRKDFGVGADMPLDGGGVVVGDKITVTLDVEAVKQG